MAQVSSLLHPFQPPQGTCWAAQGAPLDVVYWHQDTGRAGAFACESIPAGDVFLANRNLPCSRSTAAAGLLLLLLLLLLQTLTMLLGKIKYPSGERYVGSWKRGRRSGHGKWTSAPVAVPACGSHGSSCLSRDATTGTAAAVSEGKETYVGEWEEDQRSGQGVAVYADGGR